MDIKNIFTSNSALLIFSLTTLIAFISWIVKVFIENPIEDSRNTFHKFIEKRIEILTEIKSLLEFINIFSDEETSKEYKQKLQDILMTGRSAYVDKNMLELSIKISADLTTNKNSINNLLNIINKELHTSISKIQDEHIFYKNYSNFNPVKKVISLTYLSLLYILSLLFIALTIISILYFFLYIYLLSITICLKSIIYMVTFIIIFSFFNVFRKLFY